MKLSTFFATLVMLSCAVAGAVAYCHSTFAPKTIVTSVEQTRAVVCMMAIKTVSKEESAAYCGDIIRNK